MLVIVYLAISNQLLLHSNGGNPKHSVECFRMLERGLNFWAANVFRARCARRKNFCIAVEHAIGNKTVAIYGIAGIAIAAALLAAASAAAIAAIVTIFTRPATIAPIAAICTRTGTIAARSASLACSTVSIAAIPTTTDAIAIAA